MSKKTDPRAAAAESIMAGLLAIATDSMRKMTKGDALAACDGLDSGTHVLTFGVSITGRETVIKGELTDVVTGASIDMPAMRVRPEAGGLVVVH